MPWPGLVLAAVVLVAAALWWQFRVAEGAYLGRRTVIALYDRFAPRYDAVKEWDPADEQLFVGGPLAVLCDGLARPWVLDVATGTGRVPVALAQSGQFRGRVVALDGARRMLEQALTRPTAGLAVDWLHAYAVPLPFADATFDVVTCLEALEFLPDPRAALREMVRTLRPGGYLFITNRTGWEAWLLPGHAIPARALPPLLASLGLDEIDVRPWQMNYDWVLARKMAQQAPSSQPF